VLEPDNVHVPDPLLVSELVYEPSKSASTNEMTLLMLVLAPDKVNV
jgi:hypothetical protein